MKLEVANEQLRLDLVELHHPDYLVHPEIWVVEALHSAGVAKWDGVSQPIVGIGKRIFNFFDAIMNQYEGFLTDGAVDALSLGIVVEDLDGVEIFRNAGGIEVLRYSDGSDSGGLGEQILLNDEDELQLQLPIEPPQ